MTSAQSLQANVYPRANAVSSTQGIQHPLSLLALSAGLLFGMMSYTNPAPAAASSETANPAALADGVYTFGESPVANQIGVTYMVMEVKSGVVAGGFYQLSSSYDCFQGTVQGSELALTVTASFEEPDYSFTLAMAPQGAIASQQGSTPPLVPVGFYPLADLTEVDHTVLQACQI